MNTLNGSPNKNISINNDKDLVELAGYHAYTYPQRGDILTVNGIDYQVRHENYEDPTGLDAMTIMNMDTEEMSIIYVGTDASGKYGKMDILTDAQLLSDLTPAQLAAAEAYIYTQDMSNHGFTVNLHACPSTGGQDATNVMYSWCLISAWGDTTPTIGSKADVDCLTPQVTNADTTITLGGAYHPRATCMFMEVT